MRGVTGERESAFSASLVAFHGLSS